MGMIRAYRKACDRTWNQVDFTESVLNASLGIAGEAGEIVDLVKKWKYQGHDLDPTDVKEELGDLLYYIDRLSRDVGFSLQDVMTANIEKLQKRYPDGFSEERSKNRRK